MNTHTIRWSGNKSHRIITFTPKFEEKLLAAHPRAAHVVIAKLSECLYKETGHKHTLDYDQEERLKVLLKCASSDYKHHMIDKWLVDGVRIMDANLITILECLDWAYKKIES